MKKEERQAWSLDQQEKVKFSAQLKDLQELPVMKLIFEKMISRRIALADKIDNLDTPEQEVFKARVERGQILSFINSWHLAIFEGKRAEQEIARWREFEDKKEQARKPGGDNVNIGS